MEVNNNGHCHCCFLTVLTNSVHGGIIIPLGWQVFFFPLFSSVVMGQHILSKDLSFLLRYLHSCFLSLSSALLAIGGGRASFLVFPGLQDGFRTVEGCGTAKYEETLLLSSGEEVSNDPTPHLPGSCRSQQD